MGLLHDAASRALGLQDPTQEPPQVQHAAASLAARSGAAHVCRPLPASGEHMATLLSFTIFTVLGTRPTCRRSGASVWATWHVAIQNSFKERNVCAGSSRMWYLCAIDLNPGVGRLSHHLGILPIWQLFIHHGLPPDYSISPWHPDLS